MSMTPIFCVYYGTAIKCRMKEKKSKIKKYNENTGKPYFKEIEILQNDCPKWVEILLDERDKNFNEQTLKKLITARAIDERGTRLLVGLEIEEMSCNGEPTLIEVKLKCKEQVDAFLIKNGIPKNKIGIVVAGGWN